LAGTLINTNRLRRWFKFKKRHRLSEVGLNLKLSLKLPAQPAGFISGLAISGFLLVAISG
jgi:hypothetical protein